MSTTRRPGRQVDTNSVNGRKWVVMINLDYRMYTFDRAYLNHKKFLASCLAALALLGLSLVINFYAGTYAQESASNSVTDMILSNIPVYDLDWIFTYGALIFYIFVGVLCLANPKWIPYVVKSLALFVIIRSVFISLTHIGPFPTQIAVESQLFDKLTFGADLFFSGHTGMPFLLALIFWDKVWMRIFFTASAIFFGITVLLAHLHYSIDVLSAFFITYTIYHMAELFFKKDRRLFHEGLGALAK